MRILVIDDNQGVADTMRIVLDLLGHETRLANCGETGVAMANEWCPAVVLSDIGLPDINGFAVAERLRKNKSLRNTTLVALTAYDTEATQNRAYASGFDLVLVKPADIIGLMDTLAAKERYRALRKDAADDVDTDVVSAPSCRNTTDLPVDNSGKTGPE